MNSFQVNKKIFTFLLKVLWRISVIPKLSLTTANTCFCKRISWLTIARAQCVFFLCPSSAAPNRPLAQHGRKFACVRICTYPHHSANFSQYSCMSPFRSNQQFELFYTTGDNASKSLRMTSEKEIQQLKCEQFLALHMLAVAAQSWMVPIGKVVYRHLVWCNEHNVEWLRVRWL